MLIDFIDYQKNWCDYWIRYLNMLEFYSKQDHPQKE